MYAAYDIGPFNNQYQQNFSPDNESFLNQTSFTTVNLDKMRQESIETRKIECTIEFLQIGEVLLQ
jgi:hypothetical protein